MVNVLPANRPIRRFTLSFLGGATIISCNGFSAQHGGVYPSLLGFIATIAVFLIVIYLARHKNRTSNELRRLQRLPQQIPNQTALRLKPASHLCLSTVRKRVLLQPTPMEPIWTTSTRHKPVLPNHRRLQPNSNYQASCYTSRRLSILRDCTTQHTKRHRCTTASCCLPWHNRSFLRCLLADLA